jgi:hypothetical protein
VAIEGAAADCADHVLRELGFDGPPVYGDWRAWTAFLADGSERGERFLLKLHFRRGRSETSFREGARVLCVFAYALTGDVRYFNELLWFTDTGDADRERAFRLFQSRVNAAGIHPYPKTIASGPDTPAPESVAGAGGAMKIGLLGYPHKFRALATVLRSAGYRTEAVHIPYGPKNLRRRIMAMPGLRTLSAQLCGWRGRTTWIPVDGSHPEIRERLASLGFDLAIHRLGMIIRRDMIAGCGRGILNDHFGLLPYVRGRSSVEFSLLHGIPVGGTVHFVDEGIDTGSIIGHWTYRLGDLDTSSVESVKKEVMRRSDDRFAAAVSILARPDFRSVANPLHAGVRYYSMAPVLVRYVDARLSEWVRLAC